MRNRKIQNLILAVLVGATLLLSTLTAYAAPASNEATYEEAAAQRCPYPWKRNLYLRNPFMQGKDVRELQRRLNLAFGPNTLEVDGVFGPRTRAVVIDFQELVDLKQDGIVGPKTQNVLDGVCVPQTPQ